MDAPGSETETLLGAAPIDFRALDYIKPVDENLICPICHAAMVNPVDTDCGHTFCRECITEALLHSPSCPIDRISMVVGAALPASNKIIRNQLDALVAHCPLCEEPHSRSALVDHIARDCPNTPVLCASSTCQELIRRKLFDNGCLHFSVKCPDCYGEMKEANLEVHRDKFCEERNQDCVHCGIRTKRIKEAEHLEVCPDFRVACTWAQYGCEFYVKRRELETHKKECNLKMLGQVVDGFISEIALLRQECKDLTEKNLRHERLLRILEGAENNIYRAPDVPDLSNSAPGPADSAGESLDTPHDYILNLLEAQQNRMGQLSASMTELDARQSMLVFNEAMSRQTEIAELRSAQQVISMHVRWLMNFRRQENQRRGYNTAGGGVSIAQPSGSGAELPLPRRLSDSATRDLTKL